MQEYIKTYIFLYIIWNYEIGNRLDTFLSFSDANKLLMEN